MKRILAVIVAMVALAVFAGSAQADRSTGPTCGGNNPTGHGAIDAYHFFHSSNPSVWEMFFDTNCGSGATIEYEVQVSTDNGLHWNDLSGDDLSRTLSGSGFASHDWTITGGACSGSNDYRVHIWAASNADYPDAKYELSQDQSTC